MQGIQSWGEVALASIAAALALVFSAIPKILGFALILVIGWILAAVVARVVAALLRRLRFEDLSARSGFGGFIKNMGVTTDASGFIALLVKWFIRLMALVVAFDALGLPAISDVLRHLLLWIPNLAVGLLVLVTGGLLANALASLVRGTSSQAGLDNPLLLSQIVRVAVWAFALIVALNQIGVAATLVNSLFMAIVGAAALAFGLAFGLGGRDTAAQIIRSWYERGRTDGTRIEQAAKSAAVRAGDKRRVSPEPRTLPSNSVVLLYRLREFSINSEGTSQMANKTLNDLFLDTLKDIYYAEKQILKALPKMARAAQDPQLKDGFETHRVETEGHVDRLEQIFEIYDKPARGKQCDAILGILDEGKEIMEEYKGTIALDAGLISAAQAVEHYEMARYGTLRTWAQLLNMPEAVTLLEATLTEERATDAKLTLLAQRTENPKAA